MSPLSSLLPPHPFSPTGGLLEISAGVPPPVTSPYLSCKPCGLDASKCCVELGPPVTSQC